MMERAATPKPRIGVDPALPIRSQGPLGGQRPEGAWRLYCLGLMLASGFAALGYQIVWTQQGALWLGHEAAAMLAVVTAFFGGLSLGALGLSRRIERSVHPARWYAACEALTGLWGLALLALQAPAGNWLFTLIGPLPSPAWHWSVAFCGSFVLLLPATVAMGATLPAIERALRGRGLSLAGLYAGNTFGAVVGVLATAFWLVPALGLARTALLCAALNGLCAVLALGLFGGRTDRPSASAPGGRGGLGLLALTGLLGIGHEVLVVRALSQVAESTVYTFALLLAVYLVGSAAGAALYQRHAQRVTAQGLLTALGAACLLGSASLWAAPAAKAVLLRAMGPGMAAALVAEAALAVAAFGLPTLVMGALFSHLASAAVARGSGFGRALGINTLGATAAPLLFGVLLLPALGAKTALLLIAAGYLALAWRAWSSPTWLSTALGGLALAVVLPPLMLVEVPEGGRIVRYRDGAMAAVSVVEDADGVARLRIDNHQQEGSNSSRVADARQALLPLLLHPAPRHALFLGLGTGVTAASAAQDRQLQVDAAELLPEVIEASAFFTEPLGDTGRLHPIAADARRYVRAAARRYDLIVADNFHPARSGSGALYTVEHFAAVKARLADGGLFCQWLPLHQLDLATLRSIVRSFLQVNPGGWALLATNSVQTPVLGLVATADGHRIDRAALRQRLASVQLPQPPADFGLPDDMAVLGSFIGGPQALARFAADAPLNTDDHPVVSYRAPRATYAPEAAPRDRLLALLQAVDIRPDELLTDTADSARLAAYWTARNRFLEAGRDVQPSADVRQMLAQVQEPLLAVLRISPDFRPAYEPLLRMAEALERINPGAAQALMGELQRLRAALPQADALQKAPPL
jgi:spermidine synthase